MKKCVVNGCSNKRTTKIKLDGTKITFHLFPKNEELCKKWLNALGMDNWTPGKYSSICSEHFHENDFDKTSPFRTYLKNDAVPVLSDFHFDPSNTSTSKDTSEYLKSVIEPGHSTTHYNQEGNYEASKNTNIAIKMEPGLTDNAYRDCTSEVNLKYSVAGCSRLKEDVSDSMIDLDNTTSLKQEHENHQNSTAIQIKVEPDLTVDDFQEYVTNDSTNNSSEGCIHLKEITFDAQTQTRRVTPVDKDLEMYDSSAVKKKKFFDWMDINGMRDDCQVFGDFIAAELRNLKSNDDRRKLKKVILKVILEISESED